MSWNINQYVRILKGTLLFWVIMFGLFTVYRHYGAEYLNDSVSVYSQWNLIIIFGFYGVLIGVVHATTVYVFEKYTSKKLPLWVNLFIMTTIFLGVVILISTGIIELINSIYDLNIDNKFGWWRADKTFWVILLYTVFSTILYSFLRLVSDKFGKGVFAKTLIR